MHFNLRNWLGLAFLLAVAAATVYWSRMETAELLGLPDVPALPEGYYLRDAILVVTDETGAIRYRITAANAEEQPARERLLLTDFQLQYRAPDNVLWRLSASAAEAPVDRSYFDLSGDVQLAGDGPEGMVPLLLRTTHLRLEPETWIVSSKSRVSMMRGGWRLSGVGLRADLMAGHVELESDGHGQFLRQ